MADSLIEKNTKYLLDKFNVHRIEALLEFPRFFEIETIHACNARCRMCTIDTWPRRSSRMTNALFEKIVREIQNHVAQVDTITLCRDGEPLMDKQLEEKIIRLKQIGLRNTVFSTNASLLDSKRAESLLQSGLDEIMFSVDGMTRETFEKIRIGLDFEVVKANILNFLEVREKLNSNCKVRVRMIIQDLNQNEFKKWQQYWKKQVRDLDKVYARPLHSWGNQLDVKNIQHDKITSQVGLCTSLWSTMIIHSDGSVPACSVDYANTHLSGSVEKKTIAELWRSSEFENLREKHLNGNANRIHLCRDCHIWDPAIVVH